MQSERSSMKKRLTPFFTLFRMLRVKVYLMKRLAFSLTRSCNCIYFPTHSFAEQLKTCFMARLPVRRLEQLVQLWKLTETHMIKNSTLQCSLCRDAVFPSYLTKLQEHVPRVITNQKGYIILIRLTDRYINFTFQTLTILKLQPF